MELIKSLKLCFLIKIVNWIGLMSTGQPCSTFHTWQSIDSLKPLPTGIFFSILAVFTVPAHSLILLANCPFIICTTKLLHHTLLPWTVYPKSLTDWPRFGSCASSVVGVNVWSHILKCNMYTCTGCIWNNWSSILMFIATNFVLGWKKLIIYMGIFLFKFQIMKLIKKRYFCWGKMKLKNSFPKIGSRMKFIRNLEALRKEEGSDCDMVLL